MVIVYGTHVTVFLELFAINIVKSMVTVHMSNFAVDLDLHDILYNIVFLNFLVLYDLAGWPRGLWLRQAPSLKSGFGCN